MPAIDIFVRPFMICQKQSTDSELLFDVNAATSECEMPVMTNKQRAKERASERVRWWCLPFWCFHFLYVALSSGLTKLQTLSTSITRVLPPTISVMSPQDVGG